MAPWTQALLSDALRFRACSISRNIGSGMLIATFFVLTGVSMNWYDHRRQALTRDRT